MIEARGLTKRFGDKLAVDQLSFTVEPGRITGFLGPNGAGKTTTMRLILGLDHPTGGSVTVNGQRVLPQRHPDARGRRAAGRARPCTAAAAPTTICSAWPRPTACPGGGWARCWTWSASTEVAGKRSKGFSLGMGQRLGIAAALLGDPAILMFDEPVNGLDPEGILWIRTLMKQLAGEGRTVFVSSHLMSEMENTADHLIVIGRGRLIADCSVAEFIERNSAQAVRVRTPQPDALVRRRPPGRRPGGRRRGDAIVVHGLAADRVGDLAYENGIRLHELAPAQASLEEAFMELTAASVEFRAGGGRPGAGPEQGDRVSTGGVA